MAQFQKDTKFTIEIKISRITNLVTSNYLPRQSIKEYIAVVNSEMESGGNLVIDVKNLSQSTKITGIFQKRGILNTDGVKNVTSEKSLLKNVNVKHGSAMAKEWSGWDQTDVNKILASLGNEPAPEQLGLFE